MTIKIVFIDQLIPNIKIHKCSHVFWNAKVLYRKVRTYTVEINYFVNSQIILLLNEIELYILYY